MTLNDYKIAAYDTMRQIDYLSNQLQQLNKAIIELEAASQSVIGETKDDVKEEEKPVEA